MVLSKNPMVWVLLALAAAVTATGGMPVGAQNRPPPTDVEQLKVTVAPATRMLASEGIIASSGHVSARIPGTDRVATPKS